MGQEPIDYEVVLADLQSKRDSLDTAIAAIRGVLTAGAHVSVGTGAGAAGKPIDPASIPDDSFFSMSISDAAKKYLGMVRRKQGVKEIADALDRGGLAHSSTNFVDTVRAMLNRAAQGDPELVRVGRGEWGLSAWYGNRRPKATDSAKKATKRGKRGRPKKVKTGSAEAHANAKDAKPRQKPGPKPKIKAATVSFRSRDAVDDNEIAS